MANTISILITAKDQASKVLRGVNTEMGKNATNADKLKGALSTAGRVAGGLFVAGTTAATTGLIAASKAAFDQVKAVEEARFGLQAYEKDAGKVDKVLGDLVAYAQSDMGVLFNRKDMFAAASTLKMYGNETDTLAERVKILSKGVSQGKTTFQELSAIVGRAAAKGRLDAVDFDMLIERGIGLDRKFRGAAVSADELWQALNTALPDELLSARAQTIEGRFIRLQSAFRNVGNAVLGVDAVTNNFIEGGIGDRFMGAVEGATGLLREIAPVVRDVMGSFLDTADSVYQRLSPALTRVGAAISGGLIPAFQQAIQSPFAQWLGGVLVGGARAALYGLEGLILATSSFLSQLSTMTPLLIMAATSLGTYKLITTTVTVATGAWALAQRGLNAALMANPVGLVIAGAIGIVTAYASAVNSTNSNANSTRGLAAARDQLKLATDSAKQAEDNLKGAQLSAQAAALAVERAQRTYNETVAQYGPESLEAREAAQQLSQAQYNLEQANGRAKQATLENKEAQKELAALKDALAKAEAEKRAALDPTTRSLWGQDAAVNSLSLRLDGLNGKTVTYNVRGNVDNAEAAKAAGYKTGAPFKNAVGTAYSPGGQTLVGEHGPELVNLPQGARVIPNYQTRQMMQSDGPSTISIQFLGPVSMRSDSDVRDLAQQVDKQQRLAQRGVA